MFFNAQGRILESRMNCHLPPRDRRDCFHFFFSAGACFLVSESPARIGRDDLVSKPRMPDKTPRKPVLN